MQFVGLAGLIVYHVEFLDTPALQISLKTNLPDLLRAIAELLWPIAAILGVFWFLPQVLDFFNDPRKSAPLLQALSGKGLAQDHQGSAKIIEVGDLPLHEELSEAHKELIELYESQLKNLPEEEERSRLLIHAANCELRAIFEYVYNKIFGSQLQALQSLGANPNMDLMPFYEIHVERTESAKEFRRKSFDIWLQLLKDCQLLVESSGKFSLSNRGILFLKFLKKNEAVLDKLF